MNKPITWIGALLTLCGLFIAYQGLTATSRRHILGIIPFFGHSSNPDPIETIIGLVVAAGGAYLVMRSLKKTA